MPTVLISGANRGLGFEFVRQYTADKWDVIACCRVPESAADLRELALSNPKIRIEALDTGDQASIAALVKRLGSTPIDVLINNAGVLSGAADGSLKGDTSQTFGTLDADAWAKVLAVNSIAPIMMTEQLRHLVAKSDQRKIINISSFMGSIGRGGQGFIAYRTSKAALNMAMVCVKDALSSDKITIINFHPGWVQTDMGGKGADITPTASISGMRQVIATLSSKDTGKFYDYKGDILPW